jgi:hypothetical protein
MVNQKSGKKFTNIMDCRLVHRVSHKGIGGRSFVLVRGEVKTK